MNYFDIFAIVTTIGLAIVGFREGLVRGIIKLAGFFALVAVLVHWSDQIIAAGRTLPVLPDGVAVALAFIVPFILGIIALNIVAGALHRLIHMTPAGFIDNGLGTLFGIVEAVILTGLIAVLFSLTPADSPTRGQYEESRTGPYVRGIVREVVPFLDRKIRDFEREPPRPPDIPDNEHERDNLPA